MIFSEWPKISMGVDLKSVQCEMNGFVSGLAQRSLLAYGTGSVSPGYREGFGFSKRCDDNEWSSLLLDFKISLLIILLIIFVPILGLYYVIALMVKGCCYRHACELRFQKIIRKYLSIILAICIAMMMLSFLALFASSMRLLDIRGGSHTYLYHYFEDVSDQIRHVLRTNYDEFSNDFMAKSNRIIDEYVAVAYNGGKNFDDNAEKADNQGKVGTEDDDNKDQGNDDDEDGDAKGKGTKDEDKGQGENNKEKAKKDEEKDKGKQDKQDSKVKKDENKDKGNHQGRRKRRFQRDLSDSKNDDDDDVEYEDDEDDDDDNNEDRQNRAKYPKNDNNNIKVIEDNNKFDKKPKDLIKERLDLQAQLYEEDHDDMFMKNPKFNHTFIEPSSLIPEPVIPKDGLFSKKLFNSIHEVRSNTFMLREEFAILVDYLRFFNRNLSLYLMWHPTGLREIEQTGISGIEHRSIKFKDLETLDDSMRAMDDVVSRFIERRHMLRVIPRAISGRQNKTIEQFKMTITWFLDRFGKLQGLKHDIIDDTLWESYPQLAKTQTLKLPRQLGIHAQIFTYIIFLIIILLTVGLIIGSFGPRTYHERIGYNKATGGNILLCTVVLILCIFSFFCAIVVMHFFYGVIAYNTICNPEALSMAISDTKHPQSSTMYHSCGDDDTIFGKLEVENYVVFPELKNTGQFNRIVETMMAKLSKVSPKIRSTKHDSRTIERMARTANNFRRTQICRSLSGQMQLKHMEAIVMRLKRYLKESNLRDQPNRDLPWGPQIRARAECIVQFFDKDIIDAHIKRKMYPKFLKIENHCGKLMENFRGSVVRTIRENLAKDDKRVRTFSAEMESSKAEMITHLKEEYKKSMTEYNAYVRDALSNKIGHCAFISKENKALVELQCKCLSDPLNGYWASGFIIILFLLPATISAMALASLFRKSCVDYDKRDTLRDKPRPALRPVPPPKWPRVHRSRSALYAAAKPTPKEPSSDDEIIFEHIRSGSCHCMNA